MGLPYRDEAQPGWRVRREPPAVAARLAQALPQWECRSSQAGRTPRDHGRMAIRYVGEGADDRARATSERKLSDDARRVVLTWARAERPAGPRVPAQPFRKTNGEPERMLAISPADRISSSATRSPTVPSSRCSRWPQWCRMSTPSARRRARSSTAAWPPEEEARIARVLEEAAEMLSDGGTFCLRLLEIAARVGGDDEGLPAVAGSAPRPSTASRSPDEPSADGGGVNSQNSRPSWNSSKGKSSSDRKSSTAMSDLLEPFAKVGRDQIVVETLAESCGLCGKLGVSAPPRRVAICSRHSTRVGVETSCLNSSCVVALSWRFRAGRSGCRPSDRPAATRTRSSEPPTLHRIVRFIRRSRSRRRIR